jgi:hypothetical protein
MTATQIASDQLACARGDWPGLIVSIRDTSAGPAGVSARTATTAPAAASPAARPRRRNR